MNINKKSYILKYYIVAILLCLIFLGSANNLSAEELNQPLVSEENISSLEGKNSIIEEDLPMEEVGDSETPEENIQEESTILPDVLEPDLIDNAITQEENIEEEDIQETINDSVLDSNNDEPIVDSSEGEVLTEEEVKTLIPIPNVEIDAPRGGIDHYTSLLIRTSDPLAIIDASAFNHSIIDSVIVLNNDQWLFDKTALFFDGKEDHLYVSDHETFDLGEDDFTIDFWIYPLDTNTKKQSLIGQYGMTDASWRIVLDPQKKLFFDVSGEACGDLLSEKNLNLSSWSHVVYVRHNNLLSVFIDGQKSGESSCNGALINSQSILEVGISSFAGYFNGYLDEVRISKGIARWENKFTPSKQPYDDQNPPEVENINIIGPPNVGKTLTAEYEYIDENNDAEGTSIYRWLVSSAVDGAYALVSAIGTKTYQIKNEDAGKFLFFEVTPVSQNAPQKGITKLSEPYGRINTIPEVSEIIVDADYLSTKNETDFTLACRVLESDEDVVLVEYSFDNGDHWNQLGDSLQGPVENLFHETSLNLFEIQPQGYEEEGDKNIGCRVSDSKSLSETMFRKIIKDTLPPEIVSEYAHNDEWVSHPQEIFLNIKEEGSGIKEVKYCWGESCDPVTGQVWEESIQIVEDKNEIIKYQAWDNAGNISAIVQNKIKVDRTAPTGLFIETQKTNDWTIVFKIQSGIDLSSGINTTTIERQKGVLKNGICENYGEWNQVITLNPEVNQSEYVFKNEQGEIESGCYKFRLKSIDKAGNESLQILEKEEEIGTVPIVKNLEIKGIQMAGETLRGVYLYEDQESDTEAETQYKWLRSNTGNGVYTEITGANRSEYQVTSEDQGKYILFEITPYAGHPPVIGEAKRSSSLKINTKPIINSSWTESSIINTFNEKKYQLGCTGITDPDEDDVLVFYSFNNGKDWYLLGTPVQGPLKNYTHKSFVNLFSLKPTGYESQGKKEILCKVSDGITETLSSIITIDKDTWSPNLMIDYPYDGKWINKAQTIKIRATDNESHIAYTKYCQGETCNPNQELVSEVLSISENKDETFRFQTWDMAGNISQLTEIHVKIDVDLPRVVKPIDEGVFSRDQTLEFKWGLPQDNFSGVETLRLCIDQDKQGPCDKTITLSPSLKSFQWENAEWRNEYFARIQAVDYAGNISVWSDWSDGITPSADPPVAREVEIQGDLYVGEILTGSYLYSDTEDDPEAKTLFQWYRSKDNVDFLPIEGATTRTYQITIDDIDHYIQFEVSPKSSFQPEEGLSMRSSSSEKVIQLYKTESWAEALNPEGEVPIYIKTWKDKIIHTPQRLDIELMASARHNQLGRKSYYVGKMGEVEEGEFSTRLDSVFGEAPLKTIFKEIFPGNVYLKSSLYDEHNLLLAEDKTDVFSVFPQAPPKIELNTLPSVVNQADQIISGIIQDPNLSSDNGLIINDEKAELSLVEEDKWQFTKKITLSEGSNSIHLNAADTLGNKESKEIHITLDTQPPLPPILKTPLDPSGFQKTKGIQYSSSGNVYLRWERAKDVTTSLTHYEVWRTSSNDFEQDDGESHYKKVSESLSARLKTWRDKDLEDRQYKYQIKSFDEAGNQSASNEEIIVVDSLAPVVDVLSPESNTLLNTNTIEIKIAHEDDQSPRCQIKDNLDSWIILMTDESEEKILHYVYRDLEEGTHSFNLECYDLAGNMTQKSIENMVIDTTPPKIFLQINDGDLDTLSEQVTLDVISREEKENLQCRYKNESLLSEWTDWEVCRNKKQWTLPPEEGDKKVLYEIRDQAGNIGKYSDSILFRLPTEPVARNISIEGLPMVGETIKGHYIFEDSDGDREKSSKYRWYSSILQDGEYTEIQGANLSTLRVPPSEYGKYIKFEVTPLSEGKTKNTGQRELSPAFGPILSEEALYDLRSVNNDEVNINNTLNSKKFFSSTKKIIKVDESQKLKIDDNQDDSVIEDQFISDVLKTFMVEGNENTDDTISISVLNKNDVILASKDNAQLELKKETVFFGLPDWDGTIEGPKNITDTLPALNDRIIEGAISTGTQNAPILLDTPAKIIIPTSEGTPHYSIDGEHWIEIINICNDENGSYLLFPEECYFKTGDTTIIWTYHFTKFGNISDKMSPKLEKFILSPDNTSIDIYFSEGVFGQKDMSTPLSIVNFEIEIQTKNRTAKQYPFDVLQIDGTPLAGGETDMRLILSNDISEEIQSLSVYINKNNPIYDRSGNQNKEEVFIKNLKFHSHLNISEIQIQGDLSLGSTITADFKYGENFLSEGVNQDAFHFYWYKSSSPEGPFSRIKDQDHNAYKIKPEDKDTFLQFEVAPIVNPLEKFKSPLVGPVLGTAPSAEKVFISGLMFDAQEITGNYSYIDMDKDPEGDSLYRWFISENKEGPFEIITGESFLSYNIKTEDVGKYIQFEITPMALTGNPAMGEPVSSLIYGPTKSSQKLKNVHKNISKKEFKFSALTPGIAHIEEGISTLVLGADQKISFTDNIEETLFSETEEIIPDHTISQAFEKLGRSHAVKTKSKKISIQSGILGEAITFVSNDDIEVTIPDQTTIYGEGEWDGSFAPPQKVLSSVSIPGASIINSIMLGETGKSLILTASAKISFPYSGSSDSKVFYSIDGVTNWKAITTECTDAQGSHLEFPMECYYRNDTGIDVWTYHFTHYSEAGDQVTEGVTFSLGMSDGVLSVGIVDNVGDPVSTTSVNMSSITTNFVNQNATGVLGTSSEQIILYNPTSTQAWSVTLAASGGTSAVWEELGTNTIDFNATDGTGQLTINPSGAIVSLVNINTSTGAITSLSQEAGDIAGISLGSSASFEQGITDNITLFTSSTAAAYKAYSLQGVSLSQLVPSDQPAGDYQLDLILTSS